MMSDIAVQRATTSVVSTTEWRWVIIFAGLLVAVGLLPYAWAFAGGTNAAHSFTGILYAPYDGATLLAKMGQGARGAWLLSFPYTPEPTQQVMIHTFYLMLGQLANLLGLSPLLMFHIARLMTGFMMFVALYHLGSTIWGRLRPRRLFFFMLAVGSGLGWLVLALTRGLISTAPPDLSLPEAIPFYASLVNPHYPLAIALTAMIAAMCITIFRPGFAAEPTIGNGGISLAALALTLSVVQPFAWIPIAATVIAYVAILIVRTRRIPVMELRWTAMIVLPALPMMAYYLAALSGNPALRLWNDQSQIQLTTPPPWEMLIGYGLPLLVAIPGLVRAVRRFERDGDRFMLVWLVVNTVLIYLPFSFQRRMTIGLFIPIAYFAVRSLEDYWFYRISPKWRLPALIALFVFMIPSNVIAAGVPLFGVLSPRDGEEAGLLLTKDYAAAIQWLNTTGERDEIVLAPEKASLWIPAYTPQRVVYGHPTETLNAALHRAEVVGWYLGLRCAETVQAYKVRFILTETGDSPCLTTLGLTRPTATFGKVAIYRVE